MYIRVYLTTQYVSSVYESRYVISQLYTFEMLPTSRQIAVNEYVSSHDLICTCTTFILVYGIIFLRLEFAALSVHRMIISEIFNLYRKFFFFQDWSDIKSQDVKTRLFSSKRTCLLNMRASLYQILSIILRVAIFERA